MIITIKTQYSCENKEFHKILKELRREQSCVIRWAYNRFKKEHLSQKEVQTLSKDLKYQFSNIKSIDSWFIQSAVKTAKGIYERFGEETVIFGGKFNFFQRLKNKISKEQFKNQKLSNLTSIGEAPQKGNRKFELDIEKNIVIFKPKRGVKFELKLKLKPNYKKKLELLEEHINETPIPYTVSLNEKEIFISFDESHLYQEEQLNLIEDRYISLDLNPNHVGVVVCEKNRVLKKLDFDLSGLTQPLENIRKKRHYRDPVLETYLNNKLNYETIQISKQIEQFIKAFCPKYLFLEDLSIKSGDTGRGRRGNKLINNLWKRNLFSLNLIKRAENLGLECYKINPKYSSYIGNLQNSSFDPINSALEVGRRGIEALKSDQTWVKNQVIKLRKGCSFDIYFPKKIEIKDSLMNQWKKDLEKKFQDSWKEKFKEIKKSLKDSWRKLFETIKTLNLRYRVSSLSGIDYDELRLKTKHSKVIIISFI